MSHDLVHRRSLKDNIYDALHQLRPSPIRTHFGHDLMWIVGFIFIQEIVIAKLAPAWLKIDIITPWVILCSITRPTNKNIFQYVLVCCLLESFTTVPFGFYFSVYAIPVFVLPLIRPKITWSFLTPWFASFLTCLVWVHCFKMFAYVVLSKFHIPSTNLMLLTFTGIVTGTIIGTLICLPYKSSEFFAREGFS